MYIQAMTLGTNFFLVSGTFLGKKIENTELSLNLTLLDIFYLKYLTFVWLLSNKGKCHDQKSHPRS